MEFGITNLIDNHMIISLFY